MGRYPFLGFSAISKLEKHPLAFSPLKRDLIEMARLDQLPVELIQQICSLLCPHCLGSDADWFKPLTFEAEDRIKIREGHHALAALCRTSGYLRSVAESYLHHFIYQWKATELSLASTTQALTSRPYLGQAVKTVEIRGDRVGCLSRAFASHFEDVAAGYHVKLPEGWAESDDPKVRSSVILQLLLLHICGAKDVSFTLRLCADFDILEAVQAAAANSGNEASCFLPKLHRLAVYFCGPTESRLGLLAPLLRLAPNLSTLCLQGAQACETGRGMRLAGVTILNLDMCNFNPDALAGLIGSCSRLEVLNMKWDTRGPIANKYGLQPHHVLGSLQKHKESLRSLSMDVIRSDPWCPPADLSLVNFSNLESLWINFNELRASDENGWSAAAFFLPRLLPQSLRRLYLLDDALNVGFDFAGLDVLMKQGEFPELAEIACFYDRIGTPQAGNVTTSPADGNRFVALRGGRGGSKLVKSPNMFNPMRSWH
ncbi:hypothetical protein B0T16DRAFT_50815 [Cercophora newfieldiana]|uniref:Uncharacterized protein n=1 Tax=Cercophora newfieldiana TaxID=92897 RepID=A0AA39YSV3_9PEZI|nr:hypothetical protein B0T16DRAFT_50815 [Cercophora newfieldiana]